MTTQVNDALSTGVARNIRPTYGYYRQSNGWIKYATVTRLERLKYEEQGWKCLAQYGFFDPTPYTSNHPLEGLFMMGGAKELPVDQIIQMGLYIDPPLVPVCRQHLTQYHRAHGEECWIGAQQVVFPQLAGVNPELIGPFVCDFCQRKMPTKQARQQHQSVMHADELGDIQTGSSLGKALAEAMGKASVPVAVGLKEELLLQKIAELEAKVAATAETACECGGSYKKGGSNLHGLTKRHKKWAEGQVTQPA